MNGAHLHLLVNHLALVSLPFALLILWRARRGRSGMVNFALFLVVGTAALAAPAYFSGDPAEDVVRELPEIKGQHLIHPHEEAGEIALILSSLTGVAALAGLYFGAESGWGRRFVQGVFLLGLASTIELGYTAFLGGKIRHTEVRDGFVAPAEPGSEATP